MPYLLYQQNSKGRYDLTDVVDRLPDSIKSDPAYSVHNGTKGFQEVDETHANYARERLTRGIRR